MTTPTPTTATTTPVLTARFMAGEFHRWVGSLGYDTRPYYHTPSGRVRLPVAHTTGFADGSESVECAGDPVSLLATIKTLHKLGRAIIVPDYEGGNLEGELTWAPTDYGAWVSQYEYLRD